MASSGDAEGADARRGSRISRASLNQDWSSLDEYGKLVKYVSVYREGDAEEPEEAGVEWKRIWYAPWKKRKIHVRKKEEQAGKYPDEWLLTDIRQGLSSEEVSRRRQRAGWNELVSERENPIAKVLSYFRGPILYGEWHSLPLGDERGNGR